MEKSEQTQEKLQNQLKTLEKIIELDEKVFEQETTGLLIGNGLGLTTSKLEEQALGS